MPADLAASIGGTSGKGNRTDQYKDYGFELGGPIVKDRLWAWGAIGKTHVGPASRSTSAHDRTELQDTSFKGTGQVTNGIRANYTFFRGNKEKFGRGAERDASPTRRPATRPVRPPCTRARSTSSSAATCSWRRSGAHVDGGFSLDARGGTDTQMYIDDGGVSHGIGRHLHHRSAAGQHRRSTATLPRQPRAEVRLRLAQGDGRFERRLPGQRRSSRNHNGYPDMIAKITRPTTPSDRRGLHRAATSATPGRWIG